MFKIYTGNLTTQFEERSKLRQLRSNSIDCLRCSYIIPSSGTFTLTRGIYQSRLLVITDRQSQRSNENWNNEAYVTDLWKMFPNFHARLYRISAFHLSGLVALFRQKYDTDSNKHQISAVSSVVNALSIRKFCPTKDKVGMLDPIYSDDLFRRTTSVF